MISKKLLIVMKEIRDGKYTDKTFSLLELYARQLEDTHEFLTKEATEAAVAIAPLPDQERNFADRLNLLSLTF